MSNHKSKPRRRPMWYVVWEDSKTGKLTITGPWQKAAAQSWMVAKRYPEPVARGVIRLSLSHQEQNWPNK